MKMEPDEFLHPEVDCNRPIRKELADWYSEKQPIIAGNLVRPTVDRYSKGLVRKRTLSVVSVSVNVRIILF